MKNKLVIYSILIAIILTNPVKILKINAHDTHLGTDGYEEVYYDACDDDIYIDSSDIGDGIDEKWYDLMWGSVNSDSGVFEYSWNIHLDHNIKTIYYQAIDYGLMQQSDSWYSNTNFEMGEQIKLGIINSILKWNNVYLYKIENGICHKIKLIDFINFDDLDNQENITPNLIIYPFYSNKSNDAFGSLDYSNSKYYISSEKFNEINHRHYYQMAIKINTRAFLESSDFDIVIERTGAHEFGHVLGLFDLDKTENCNVGSEYHHEEVLMGYSKDYIVAHRQTNITYKDIAGAAITRGFHTNNDHIWMRKSITNGNKLICSICNLIKIVSNDELNSYEYVEYGSCENNHQLSDGNMMPVASYGNKDYYKCKYCRYVAPFESIIEQNYSIIANQYTMTYHKVTNNVPGLQYTTLEPHDKFCKYLNNISHIVRCSCGLNTTESHTVTFADANDGDEQARCLGCNRLLDLSTDIAVPIQTNANIRWSSNGSYILPSGIIVLVNEDIEIYNEGKLLFFKKEDLPSI